MTESATRGGCRTVFRFGCLGCLVLLVLVMVLAAIVFGIVWKETRGEDIEDQRLTRILKSPEPPVIADRPIEVPTEFVVEEPAGRVLLDLRHAKFDIVPAAAGESLLVEAKFDANHYGLSEKYDEGSEGDGWTYEVEFRRISSSYALTALKELLGGTKPRITIHLPRDVPYDLELDIMQGGAEVELGGLWIKNAAIRFLQGGGELGISEPLQKPAESVTIEFRQGGGAVLGIANASPKKLEVDFSMGGGYLDLAGPWQRDADITIDQSMGGVSVQLPSNVVLRGIGRFDTREPSTEEGVPVLRFSTSSNYGELEFLK